MKKLIVVLALCIALSSGCKEKPRAYTGPVGDYPIAELQQHRSFDGTGDPRLPEPVIITSILHVINPSNRDMHVVVDCDPATRVSLDLPARTSLDVLLDPKDSSCTVSEE
jgi:hypothetical protein